MIELRDIVEAVEAGRVRVTEHARAEAIEDDLTTGEVAESIRQSEILRQYPDDRPHPSCLIYSRNHHQEPLHSVWGYNETAGRAILITVYRPDPNLWINWRIRKKR